MCCNPTRSPKLRPEFPWSSSSDESFTSPWTRRYRHVYHRGMQSIRVARIAVATAAALCIVAAASPAANTPGGPTTSVKVSVSPNHLVPGLTNKHGMPITLKFHLGITHPADSRYRLDKVVVRFPSGVGAPHGELFPSCSVAQLEKAHNRLSACPRGSRTGHGIATGTAVDIGVTSSG